MQLNSTAKSPVFCYNKRISMQTHTPITLESVPVLAWEAPARPAVERTTQWYIGASVVVLVAAAYGIISGSWPFAVVSVLAGGMYVLIHDHKPPMKSLELHDSGVRVNGTTFTRWDELSGFWLLHTPNYSELHLSTKNRGDIVMQTGTQDIAQLRMILVQRLPELAQKREGILDTFIRICKL